MFISRDLSKVITKISIKIILLLALVFSASAQTLLTEIQVIRKKYQIPELAYAVVSSDSILEMQNLGFKQINSSRTTKPADRFHLGSNTKAITGFIAALLIKQKKLNWNTKFFALFPELKAKSNSAFYEVTLQELLTFRAKLPPYTYTNSVPKRNWFKDDYAKQRLQLCIWFLKQKQNNTEDNLSLTNAGYILAGLMIEKASGKLYKELVADFGKQLNINFGFDYPNLSDKSQTWGHDLNLKPLPPQNNYKLNWLLAAGNINANLPEYARFIQLQLQGLAGHSSLLTKEEFNFLHYGLIEFSVGWFWKTNDNHHLVSFNTGNAGAFITQVYIIPEIDLAYILFANSASEKTSDGMQILFN